MAEYGTYGGGDEKKKPLKSMSKSCDPSVADCSDGARPSTKKARVKMRGFNPTKSRYNLPSGKKKKVEPEPESGTHMNVRDTGGNPGQPTTTADRNTNTQERKKAEIVLTKKRKFFNK